MAKVKQKISQNCFAGQPRGMLRLTSRLPQNYGADDSATAPGMSKHLDEANRSAVSPNSTVLPQFLPLASIRGGRPAEALNRDDAETKHGTMHLTCYGVGKAGCQDASDPKNTISASGGARADVPLPELRRRARVFEFFQDAE
jgi:hypothetical protein